MAPSLARWADAHRADALDLVRIYLGLGLLVRGAVFLAEPAAYTALLPEAGGLFSSFVVTHYVALAHLAGGFFLMVGLATRLAAAVQLPILAGAAFLIHLPTVGPFSQAFGFATFVLALLAVFVAFGGGRWSLDTALTRWGERQERAEDAEMEATARAVRARPRLRPAPSRPAAPAVETPCTCEDRETETEHVDIEREYGGLTGLRFITGTHARPTRAVVRCTDCGGVVRVVEDPEALEAYRYLRSA